MNKIIKISSLGILILLFAGCGNKAIMTCNNTLDSEFNGISKEEISITFYRNKTVKKEVVATIRDKNMVKGITKDLKENYCNSELDNDYKCSVNSNKTSVILKESGKSKDVMGLKKDVSLDGYKKMLINKGFKCKKK